MHWCDHNLKILLREIGIEAHGRSLKISQKGISEVIEDHRDENVGVIINAFQQKRESDNSDAAWFANHRTEIDSFLSKRSILPGSLQYQIRLVTNTLQINGLGFAFCLISFSTPKLSCIII